MPWLIFNQDIAFYPTAVDQLKDSLEQAKSAFMKGKATENALIKLKSIPLFKSFTNNKQ